REEHLPPKDDPPAHRDALLVELITQGLVLKPQRQDRQDHSRAGEERTDRVIPHQHRRGPRNVIRGKGLRVRSGLFVHTILMEPDATAPGVACDALDTSAWTVLRNSRLEIPRN